VTNAPWVKDAVIYQINTRQFTNEGTFRAKQTKLPRLKKLGVDILWLMPTQPIGVKNHKGRARTRFSPRSISSGRRSPLPSLPRSKQGGTASFGRDRR
jgi:pullulanase/glycogen debranching enzyme